MTDFNVVATLRILPEGVDVDLEKIEKNITDLQDVSMKLNGAEKKPIAFGLEALEATVLLNDAAGGIEELQEKIMRFPGVSQVDVVDLSRL